MYRWLILESIILVNSKYCYANYDERQVDKNTLEHDDDSPLLVGYLEEDDVIKVRMK